MPIKLDPINREVLIAELVRDEGERLKTYRCTAGKLTVGVGRNLDDVGLLPGEASELKLTSASIRRNGITRAQSRKMLSNDIDRVIRSLDRHLPWVADLDEVRQRVLINMAFNLGTRGLLGFRNTLRYIAAGNYEQASVNMLKSLWARQVKGRANRLAELMRLGPRKS